MSTKSGRFGLRLEPATLEALSTLAKRQGCSVADLIREGVAVVLERAEADWCSDCSRSEDDCLCPCVNCRMPLASHGNNCWEG